MKVLLLGSGGREHALARSLARSKIVTQLFAAPGNPGIAAVAETFDLDLVDPGRVVEAARRYGIELVVIGPEAPLVAGIADALRDDGRAVFGPGSSSAALEGSKSYAKEVMDEAGVLTARWAAFSSAEKAIAFMDELGPPHVIKADGLAAGKGVVVTENRDEAVAAVEDRVVRGSFGDAGRCVVIEEFLDGEELSLIALTDGTAVVPCQPAQDYKRAFDGDRGPNTGGMGSYSPVPACSTDLADAIATEVIQPVVDSLAARGTPFIGAIYAGLVLTSEGPRVLEFNARFGDPETQAILPRLQSDLGELSAACAAGELSGMTAAWSAERCVSVVCASGGYPGDHRLGLAISGLANAESIQGVHVFHAGTRLNNGELVTAGGRVLAVSALGPTFKQARALAYDAASRIQFEGKHLRADIALRAQLAERSDS